MYFVYFWGDLIKDPLDTGCHPFESKQNAIDFAKTMHNKGYNCRLCVSYLEEEWLYN